MSADSWPALLAHLMRGGAYGTWWLTDGRRHRTYWWPADRPAPVPDRPGGNVHFAVHPLAEIPTTNPAGQPRPPQRVRGRNDVVAAVNALYAEFDGPAFGGQDAALQHIAALPLAPSVIVNSGGGWHVYWLLADTLAIRDETDRRHLQSLQAAWVLITGGDPGAKDLSRLLRVPGTRNCKPRYAPHFPQVRVFYANLAQTYTPHDFYLLTGLLTQPQRPLAVPVTHGTPGHPYALAVLRGECAALADTGKGGRNTRLFLAALKLGGWVAGGWLTQWQVEDALTTAAQSTGLPRNEIAATLASGLACGQATPKAPP